MILKMLFQITFICITQHYNTYEFINFFKYLIFVVFGQFPYGLMFQFNILKKKKRKKANIYCLKKKTKNKKKNRKIFVFYHDQL